MQNTVRLAAEHLEIVADAREVSPATAAAIRTVLAELLRSNEMAKKQKITGDDVEVTKSQRCDCKAYEFCETCGGDRYLRRQISLQEYLEDLEERLGGLGTYRLT